LSAPSNLTVLDGVIADFMPIGEPWNTNKTLLRPIVPDYYWARGDGKYSVVIGKGGIIHPVSFEDEKNARVSSCHQMVFDENPMPNSLALRTVYIHLNSKKSNIVTVQIENDFLRDIQVLGGDNLIIHQTFGGVKTINLLTRDGDGSCLSYAKAFVALPK
jgi:hypothetical protein